VDSDVRASGLIDRAQILAFRLGRHHLAERLAARSMTRAVTACGVQETPLRTAGLALHARVAGVTPAKLDRALQRDKTLLTIWAMRGAPYVVPAREAAIFTAGALPQREDAWRTFFGGWATSLGGRTASLSALVRQAAEAAREVLDGRQLPVDDLRHAIAEHMPEIRGLARPSGAHADLPEPLFRATGLLGVVCIVDARQMTDAIVARTDQWLGEPVASLDEDAARAELLRRYLRCYGPSTPQAFAEWTSRSGADARAAAFEAIESELVKVRVERSAEWLLAADVDALTSPVEPAGVRLLPAQDPFLQQRDRERLLPDREQRRRLWRPVGGPGLVLVDGRPAGTWTSRREGGSLKVIVEPFDRLSTAQRQAIMDEADSVAPLRGAERTTVALNSAL
jgi:Winged helix DNA-binding domain